MSKKSLGVASIVFIFAGVTKVVAENYVIKDGETVSDIIHAKLQGQIYGRRGYLAQVKKSNPHITNIDKVHAGQILNLPVPETVVEAKTDVVPENKPVIEVTPVEAQKESVNHRIKFSLSSAFTDLELVDLSNNTKADLASRYNFTLGAEWEQRWNHQFSSFAAVDFRKISFEQSQNNSVTDRNKFMQEFRLGMRQNITERISLEGSAGYQQNLFMTKGSNNTVSIATKSLPDIKVKALYNFLVSGQTTLGASAGVAQVFSGTAETYKVRSAQKYSAGLDLAYKDKYFLDIVYEKKDQKTSLVSVDEQNILARFSFGFSL